MKNNSRPRKDRFKNSKFKISTIVIIALSWGALAFALAWMLKEPISDVFVGKPGLAWGVTCTFIAIVIISIIIFTIRLILRKNKIKEQSKLETYSKEKLEELESKDANKVDEFSYPK